MAFGVRRWLIAALGCSALVSVAFLPPGGERTEWWWFYRQTHYERLTDMLRVYRSRLQQLELRDSLLASALEYEGVGGPSILVQDGLPRTLADTLRALAEKPFGAVREGTDEYRTIVSISAHDVYLMSGPASMSHLNFYLPVATDGETCLAAIALQRRYEADWHRRVNDAAENFALLGPCAYYAAFGRPGVHIEDWLESSDYKPAMWPAWAVDAEPLGPLSPRELPWVRSDREGDLLPCAAGNRDACRAGALRPARFLETYLRRNPAYGRERGIVGARARWWYPSAMGPNVERLLSDLLVDMGEGRFARFWTAEAPLETAFADAFGVELEDWMMRWARIQVGDIERPVPDPSWAALGLLLTAVFVGGATFLVRGRQVS